MNKIPKNSKLRKYFRIKTSFWVRINTILSLTAILAILPFYYIQFFKFSQKKEYKILKPLKKEALLFLPEDREKLEDALKYIMIRSYGMYTLLGTKPITFFSISRPKPKEFTEEELRSKYEKTAEEIEGFKNHISFEEFKRPTTAPYDEEEIWAFWGQNWQHYTGKKYVFFEIREKVDVEGESIEIAEGVFVNIFETAYILKKHYEEFKEAFGKDFDPLEVASEISSPSSLLRKNLSNYLFGLLLGFGEKNAYLYQLRHQGHIPFESALLFDEKEEKTHCDVFYKKNITVEDLPIPSFVIFSPNDKKKLKYKKEREKFIEMYEKKDFLKTTLEYLKGDKDSY